MRFPRLSQADLLALILFAAILLLIIATSAPPRALIYQSF